MRFIVATFPGREHWRDDIVADLAGQDFTVVDGWELDAIYYGTATRDERFCVLQDSWRIFDPVFFERLDSTTGSVTIADRPRHYGCYAGVYEPAVVERTELPTIGDKEDAITHETVWTSHYVNALGYEPPCLYPDLFADHRGVVVEHHGRKNLMLGNNEIRKYKGTWR